MSHFQGASGSSTHAPPPLRISPRQPYSLYSSLSFATYSSRANAVSGAGSTSAATRAYSNARSAAPSNTRLRSFQSYFGCRSCEMGAYSGLSGLRKRPSNQLSLSISLRIHSASRACASTYSAGISSSGQNEHRYLTADRRLAIITPNASCENLFIAPWSPNSITCSSGVMPQRFSVGYSNERVFGFVLVPLSVTP